MNDWTEMRFINRSDLHEIKNLQSMWGITEWRKHVSRELVKNYDLEEDRQSQLNPANCRN